MTIMLAISGAAVTALLKMQNAQATIWNRTQMHSGIRGATEVLQQEVGQAGRIALPAAVTMTGATAAGVINGSVTLPVSSTTGMFIGMKVTVGTGAAQETLRITAIPTSGSITVVSVIIIPGVSPLPDQTAAVLAHATGSPVLVFGSFTSGVVPPNMTNGSTGSVLKLYGDINDDGTMVYIEYTCDTAGHNLYRNVMSFAAASKPALAASQILLSNITTNPPVASPTPCFTYQTETVSGNTYVTDVAITLTVETQLVDQVTKQKQTETKALLNVSPRNVFAAWQLASLNIPERIQLMPPSVLALLP
jgi:hypothetical protein